MTKSAKNIYVPVIENVIIIGFLMVNTLSKQQRTNKFEEIFYIFTLYSLQMKFIDFEMSQKYIFPI